MLEAATRLACQTSWFVEKSVACLQRSFRECHAATLLLFRRLVPNPVRMRNKLANLRIEFGAVI
ncbi:hypothetical protein, partial [Ralstonia pseudosolanacearum]|uniref:hypothetical protein n=1 Tax=Ralstonia pseudosolanacearum TaxID=1310165 RepID=UPI003AADD2B2